MTQQFGPPATLPGGARLAPGETVLMGGRFMVSTIVFYLHTELVLTDRRLYSSRPNRAFGLIPVGTNNAAYPVENIAGITSGTRFDIVGVIIGLFAIVFGALAMLMPGVAPLALILVALGVVVIIGAPKQALSVMNSGGGTILIPVSFFERPQTVAFANQVSEMLARTAARPMPSVASTPSASSSTADRLRDLASLRQQGLISDEEYAAKRADVLGRL
jgi:Short C-terminal domain